jgi:hypothetical protein
MKNKDESKSKIVETTPQSKLEADETELSLEQDINLKIVVKSYQEPARPYFSSPCLLSEMEDTEDTFNF